MDSGTEVHGGKVKGKNVPEQASVQATGTMESSGRTFRFPDDRVLRMLAIQALLLQLKDPGVRNDFCTGKVLPKHSAEHLTQLDLLCAACLPQWLLGVGFVNQLWQSSDNLEKLVTQNTGVLVLKGQNFTYSKSYKDWFSIIYKLAQSPYWSDNSKRGEHPKTDPVFKVESFSFKEVDSIESSLVELPHPVCDEKRQVNMISIEPATAASSNVHCSYPSCDDANVDQNNTLENLPHEPINVLSTRISNKLMKPLNCSGAGHSGGSGITPSDTSLKDVEAKHNCRMKSGKSLPPTFAPLCSGCGGDHLGIECWKRRQHCHWCGKMGHSEAVCWRKAGACLI